MHQHVKKVPFRTTLLSWRLENRNDPAGVYQQLAKRMANLMHSSRRRG